jgi:fluoride exporter
MGAMSARLGALMMNVLLVGLGGAVGSIARYKLGGVVLHHTSDWRLPMGTLAVNLLGCFVAGVLAGLVERYDFFSADARLFLFTGLLGGFTTFSAFGLDSVFLLHRGHVGVALAYVALSVVGGLILFWIGVSAVPHRSASRI